MDKKVYLSDRGRVCADRVARAMDGHKKEDLLDVLARQADCAYLSELRNPKVYPLVADALKRIDPEEYGVREWEEAAYYIAGERISAQDGTQARKNLLEKIGKVDVRA